MSILFLLELIGTVAFAVSGAMVAIHKKMDIFGVITLGTTTAVGGGIIRDLILGITPPSAFQNPVYAILSIVVSVVVFIPSMRRKVDHEQNLPLLVMDSLGLAVFTVIGTQAGMPSGNAFLAVFVGMLTGVGGGVLRDLFAGDKPYIFVKHFYACASLLGAVVTTLCWGIDNNFAMIAGAVVVFVLRVLAAKYRWTLPRA